MAPVRYSYGTADITIGGASIRCSTTKETKLDASGNETPEWIMTYQDMAGRTVRTTQPRESTLGAVEAHTDSFYNEKGQLVKTVDPDGVTTLFAYNSEGEQEVQAVDVNQNGLIDYAGTDRLTKTTRTVTTRDGEVVERTTVQLWQVDNADTPVTASQQDVTPNGRKQWSTQFGLLTSSVTTHNAGTSSTVTTYPDNSTSETTTSHGRTTYQVRKASTGAIVSEQSLGYDVHGRLETVTDTYAGATNPTSYTYYTDDRVRTVTSPAPDAQSPRQVTSYTYHANGQKETETLADNKVVNYSYWPTGGLKRQWGARTYPVEYGYDPQGRLKTLTTWQDFAGETGAAVTTWNYDPASGRLVRKLYQDNKGPAYTYKPSGRLETRTWQRGVVTTYDYNNAGDLRLVDYSDTTPDVELMRDRAGRPATVTDAAGTRSLQYTADGRLELESFTAGMFQGFSIDPRYDGYARRDQLAVNWGGGSIATGYGYDEASRLKTVTKDNATATYTYEAAGSTLVRKIEISRDGQLVLQTDSPHDKLGRLESITSTWVPTGKVVSGYSYKHNAANQRAQVDINNGTYWKYGYDELGQVTSGKRYWSDSNTEVVGQQYGYQFDDIGNRETATTNGRVSTYTPNLLNQYSSRTVPGAVDVLGEAASDTTVTVNNERAARQGTYFHKAASVSNQTAAYAGSLNVTAVKNNSGPNGEDSVADESRPVFLPQTPESFTYDDDGNLTSDGRWSYLWDGENRLVAMETAETLPAGVARQTLAFRYDYMSRRIEKKVSNWNATAEAYQLQRQAGFVYNGWNLLSEHDISNGYALVREYAWGLDLSGSEQGAGGVGGLLFGRLNDGAAFSIFAYTYDGNGNVTTLVKLMSGSVEAAHEYDPFGETVRSTGPMAKANPFRFSTKYQDEETGLDYYGYRYYQSAIGRWLSRDPVEENGGVNLSGFVVNDPLNKIDYLGFVDIQVSHTRLYGTSTATVGKMTFRATDAKVGECCQELTVDTIETPFIREGTLLYDAKKNKYTGGYPLKGTEFIVELQGAGSSNGRKVMPAAMLANVQATANIPPHKGKPVTPGIPRPSIFQGDDAAYNSAMQTALFLKGSGAVYIHGGRNSYWSEMCIIVGYNPHQSSALLENNRNYPGLTLGENYTVTEFSPSDTIRAVTDIAAFIECVRKKLKKEPSLRYKRSGPYAPELR